MTNIYAFNQKDATELVELGCKIVEKKTDINGKEIWCCLAPNNLTFSESKNLQSTTVVKDGVCISF